MAPGRSDFIGDAGRQCAGFAGARTGQHQQRAVIGQNRFALCVVQPVKQLAFRQRGMTPLLPCLLRARRQAVRCRRRGRCRCCRFGPHWRVIGQVKRVAFHNITLCHDSG